MRASAAASAVIALLAGAVPAAALDVPQTSGACLPAGGDGGESPAPVGPLVAEVQNIAKGCERVREFMTPSYQAALAERSAWNLEESLAMVAADRERTFEGNACWSWIDLCAGDVRLYDFEEAGYGIVEPVLFTARNGATLSGHVWATNAGPASRPGIVINNGSGQAPETVYWWAAQVLAKHGYVALTFDPMDQGRSDAFGEEPDRDEGYHAQSTGIPFHDNVQDAIDFLLSTPEAPYAPRPSRAGHSHAAKQERRVRAGLNAAHNPFWRLVDPGRLGLAGHSYGATSVSWVGQQDPRVDAVVAWDQLCVPTDPGGTPVDPATSFQAEAIVPCQPGGNGAPPPLRVPSLGFAADYLPSVPIPHLEGVHDPDPASKGEASRVYNEAGRDSGVIVIRGGTHLEWSYVPTPHFMATLRGIDLSAWYTTAWFDRYVKCQGRPRRCARRANRMLLTTRWQHDVAEAAVDPTGDGNQFSKLFHSRLQLGLAGGRAFRCERLRGGCPGMVAAARDGGPPGSYSFLRDIRRPDRP